MKFNATKLLAIILALLMLCAALASCKKNEDPNTDSESVSDVEESASDSKTAVENTGLELRNYNGATMNIWYSEGTTAWGPRPLKVSEEEATADSISNAGYRRNKELEGMLGIYIDYTLSPTNPNSNEKDKSARVALETLYTSGDTAKFDIIITGARVCGALAQEGLYYDLSESDYIHPDAYYYESQVNEQMKVFDSMYYTCGFFSVGNTRALEAIFTNISILDSATQGEYAMSDLYELAFEHEWTLEEMLKIGKYYSTPVDNANNWVDEQQSYLPNGWNSYEGNYAFTCGGGDVRALYYALGGTIIEQNEGSGEYEVVMDNSVNTNLITYLQDTLLPNGADVAMLSDNTFVKSFVEGHSMFTMSCLSAIDTGATRIADSTDLKWGLMPPPLKDAGDEYRSYSDSWVMVFAGIPAACRDLDKATYLYEMFMAFSYDYLYPAYYEKTFRTTYTPDADSVQVFDIIASSRVVCFRDVYQIGGATVLDNHRALIWGKGSSGDITTMATSVRAALDTFMDELQ